MCMYIYICIYVIYIYICIYITHYNNSTCDMGVQQESRRSCSVEA